MRPQLEDLDTEQAAEITLDIIKRKGKVSYDQLQQSFRRTVSSGGQSIKSILNRATKKLIKDGEVKTHYKDLQFSGEVRGRGRPKKA
jgi:ABC-type amino acid transport substrate-binding protein